MKMTIESTSKITTMVVNGNELPARVWQGKTEGGIEVVALITRVVCAKDADSSELDRDLKEHSPPNKMAREAIDMRFILP